MINRLKVTSFGDPQHQETTQIVALSWDKLQYDTEQLPFLQR